MLYVPADELGVFISVFSEMRMVEDMILTELSQFLFAVVDELREFLM